MWSRLGACGANASAGSREAALPQRAAARRPQPGLRSRDASDGADDRGPRRGVGHRVSAWLRVDAASAINASLCERLGARALARAIAHAHGCVGVRCRLLHERAQHGLDRRGATFLAAADQYGVYPWVLLGGVVALRHVRTHDRDRLLATHANHATTRPGHPDVGYVRGSLREYPCVGGWYMSMGPDDGGYPAVEKPPERDLLARCLGMDVHEHVVGMSDLA